MSMNTDTNTIKGVGACVHSIAPNTEITHYTPPEVYTQKKLMCADLVVINVVKNKTSNGASYLSKGQYTELEACLDHDIPVVIYTWNTFYGIDHHVPNDYNDWKGKYGKVFLEEPLKEKELFADFITKPAELLLL